jgi:histidine ammonia-lyase
VDRTVRGQTKFEPEGEPSVVGDANAIPSVQSHPQSMPLVALNRRLASRPTTVVLTGTQLALDQILAVARHGAVVEFTPEPEVREPIEACFGRMMQDIERGIPVYGCNSAYGAQAGVVINSGSATERLERARAISRAIAIVDVGVGPCFQSDVVRAAMLIRINMLLKGFSAVKLADLECYRRLLNGGITPLVAQYGGLGASGDLAHNGRVVSALRRLPGTKVWDSTGRVRDAAEALEQAGIPFLELDPKAGLGLTNGDNFSSALAVLLAADALELLLLSIVAAAMTIEVLQGSNRSFHPLLDAVRAHPGQREVARICRYLLEGSNLAFQELEGHRPRAPGVNLQDAYSLRGVAQYHAVNLERLWSAVGSLTINVNSVSDNPLWVRPGFCADNEAPWGWVSGANFIAAHVAEVMDGLRKTLAQIAKLSDRQLARLVNPYHNNGLPANLSDPAAVTRCAFKGVQIQSGMFDVYASLLSIPVTTFYGVHEETNQDITTHALTSGIMGLELLRVSRYALAQHLLALAQAVDLRGGKTKLSPQTAPLYRFVRERAKYVAEERPLHTDIESIYETFVTGELGQVVRDQVLGGME